MYLSTPDKSNFNWEVSQLLQAVFHSASLELQTPSCASTFLTAATAQSTHVYGFSRSDLFTLPIDQPAIRKLLGNLSLSEAVGMSILITFIRFLLPVLAVGKVTKSRSLETSEADKSRL